MPKDSPSHLYYIIKNDEYTPESIAIPSLILTERATKEMALFYKEKYNVDIQVFSSPITSAANLLHRFLVTIRQANKALPAFKHGFVFIDSKAGQHGHAMPIIFEKNGAEESLFFLDTGQFLGTTSDLESLRPAREFREFLQKQNPQMSFWSHIGRRQIDSSSCFIDALVILKDGLRLTPSLRELAAQKLIEQTRGVHLFYMPEELMKTAQIGSFPTKSKGNPDKIIHHHRVKDEGKPTGEISEVTLAEFRKNYDVGVRRLPMGMLFDPEDQKIFGTYTLRKGQRIIEILKSRWAKHQQEGVISLSAMLANTKQDFDSAANCSKEASNSEGNRYLDVVRDKVHYEAVQRLSTIFDYLALAINNQGQFPEETIQQAKAAIDMLPLFFSDREQPNAMLNLEKFIKESPMVDREAISLARETLEKALALFSMQAKLN